MPISLYNEQKRQLSMGNRRFSLLGRNLHVEVEVELEGMRAQTDGVHVSAPSDLNQRIR